MEINQLLQGVPCACGKVHTCEIQSVYIERNAATRLKELCKDYSKILIVADENTFAAAGAQTVDALRDKYGESVIRRAKFTKDADGHMAGGLDKARRTGVTKPVPDEF